MAMNVTQDQNFSVHCDGVKTNGSTIQKNRGGGLEGKKAPNDISNSGKPPAFNTSRKQNPQNVIPIGEDLGVPKKARVSSRKALVDLTNCRKSNRLQKMAMNVIKDENFSVHFDGVKTKSSRIQKNRGGGLEGKKAPNDISNSGKPPAFNTSRKQNPKNVIPIGEDPKKAHVSGKKALVDLTDSVKPITPLQSLKKKSRKNNSIPEIADICFLHNHDECIKSQQEARDLNVDEFWRRREDPSMYPKLKEFLEMEDIIEDKVDHGSPNPPSPSRIEHLIDRDEFIRYTVTESP